MNSQVEGMRRATSNKGSTSIGQGTSRATAPDSSSQAREQSNHQTNSMSSTTVQNNTIDQSHRDHLTIEYCNQGLPTPDQPTVDASPLNTKCPFHGALLLNTWSQQSPTSMATQVVVANMPPVGFTQGIWTGTASSCGCTCGKVRRADLQGFTQEIDSFSGSSGTSGQTTERRA